MSNRSGGHGIEIRHESQRTLIMSSVIGFTVEGQGSGDIFLDDFCGRLNLNTRGQSAWCRQLNTEHDGVMCRNHGGRLWILGMKTEKIGTIIETLNGGITDVSGVFIYANRGWEPGLPAFICHESPLTLCGINDRNYSQRPIVIWARETQNGETRDLKERPWVYLSR